MSESTVRAFIEQATQALQGGHPSQALELADQARGYDSQSADALLIRAIALSQLLRVEESTASFEQAQAIDPTGPRIAYNFAVHLHSLGNLKRAREEAEKTLAQTPNHQGARQLIALIDQQEMGGKESPPFLENLTTKGRNDGPADAPPPIGYMRPGYEVPLHSIAWIERLGKAWTTVGWVLAAVSLLSFMGTCIVFFSAITQTLFSNSQAKPPDGPQVLVLFFLGWITLILILGWTVADILDRRGNWFWLVPLIICSCPGLNWIILGLYIIAGRASNYES